MKIPYHLIAAMSFPDRAAQMAEAVRVAAARGYPRLRYERPRGLEPISIACYGPSLGETWRQLARPILSMSGATRFLADRGVVADYHADMDPRAHKIKHLDPPIDGVTYLMASCCPPETWRLLDGRRVVLWHTNSGEETDDWVATHDPGQLIIFGGSSIGLTAIHLGGVLGYRHFEIHGMDNSSRAGVRHAGPHYGPKQGGYTWDAGGVTYETSRIMANAVAEMRNALEAYPICCVFHGDGLMQALIREWDLPNAACADQVEKAQAVRTMAHIPIQTKTGEAFGLLVEAGVRAAPAAWRSEVQAAYALADTWRTRARYQTGAVNEETGLALRVICEIVRPKVVIEIGTFIGHSTLALRASDRIYTCDRDNDCLPKADLPTPSAVTQFPYCLSTQMLTELRDAGVRADLFFFDGRIQDADLPLIRALSVPETVYVVDDYRYAHEKGRANVQKLTPLLPEHVLSVARPGWGDTTLAALVPWRCVTVEAVAA